MATATYALALGLAATSGAQAADVNITANTSSGVDLDSFSGSTAEVAPGITVTNAAGSLAVRATTGAWALTNNGAISSSLANAVSLGVTGSSVVNFGSITAGTGGNALALTGGGSVDNKAGATISSALSAIILGTTSAGVGSVTNAGTITQTGTSGDLVQLRFGGSVVNLAGATISANNSSNAVSVGQGTSRSVTNSGTISNTGTGNATGVLLQGGASTLTNNAGGIIRGTFNGVYTSATTPLTFTNAGLIESTGASASARAVEATGGGTFINSGTIRSTSSDGLYMARAGSVTNSGTITGATNAINFSGNFARTLTLTTGSVLNGLVQGGTGVDDLVLQGTGTEDISKFRAFETLALQGTAWTLTGAGTFSTSSSVQSGKLTVSGTLTSPTLTVASGGTLAGTGTVAGATSIASGGTLAGQSGQTLTLNSLTLNSGSTVSVALGAPSVTRLFNVTGNLTLGGTLNITNAGGLSNGLYRLFDYGGTLTDQGLAIGAAPLGTSPPDFTLQTSVANQVNLLVQIDPGITQFWNGSATTITGQIAGGSGRWTADSAYTNWTDAVGARADKWKSNTAIFQGSRTGAGTPASGTVTVDASAGAVLADTLQFIGTGWTVTGDAITLAGAGGATTIRVGDGSAQSAADSVTIASRLTGATQLVKQDLGTLILTGANDYSGGTLINAGTLRLGNGGTGGSITGNIANNGALVINRSDALTLAGVLSGTGSLEKTGAGRLTLTGNSSGFAGATTVHSGTLALNGTLGGSLNILSGARLEGSGTASTTIVPSGATVAPGNSIGTLTVGNISFASGSVYEVEVNGAGDGDRIAATGTATINGGTINVQAQSGNYGRETRYTILTAAGGITGPGFSSVTSNLAFLAPSLQQTSNSVTLTLVRNSIDFDAVGGTFNQRAAGRGLESVGAGALYDAVLNLDAAGARTAFDALSGEIHASLRTALLEDSRLPRDAVLERLHGAIAPGLSLWGQAYGNGGYNDGDGNAAHLARDTAGFLVGLDVLADETWRIGLAAGYAHQDLNVSARASTAGTDLVNLLGYAGGVVGPVRLSLGIGYTSAATHTQRNSAFPGFGAALAADYHGSLVQGFGEISYPIPMESGSVEPFGQIAAVSVSTDRFAERGGAAALQGADSELTRLFTTLGLRGSLPVADDIALDGSLGWRHAFGDRRFASTLRFEGAASFQVAGAPWLRDTATIDAGLRLRLTPALAASFRYSGVLGSKAADNAIKGGLSLDF